MSNEFNMKELENVTLKAAYPIEVGERKFETGEVIARFDKIQIANFNELVKRVSANGGYENRQLIIWEDSQGAQINFTQGVFSFQQFALLNNSRLLRKKSQQCILVPQFFQGESNEEGIIDLKKENISSVFVYDANTYKKISPIKIDETQGLVYIQEPYKNVNIDFTFCYQNDSVICVVGQKLISGFLSLDARMKTKDDITGQVKTALIHIPKLKLLTDLSLRLGQNTTPILGEFSAMALPSGTKGNKDIMEIIFLSDDIDADIL